MSVTLAPMEGVVDQYMRDILTRIGGIDLCVSEFIRVSNNLYPRRKFIEICPELESGGQTAAGVPVHVQLMGGDPVLLAENAQKVAEIGAPGIDLNFGCPAKTVNRNDAGATLLQWPERLFEITSAVRRAVPAHIPVSAKMRLGFEDKSHFLDNARAVEAAGASKLTIHARTKLEGYRPPAHWEYLVPIREALSITVVANGEIWTREDFDKCRSICNYDHYMIGRGMIARPSLGLEIKDPAYRKFEWSYIVQLLEDYDRLLREMGHPLRQAGRLKQWIKLMGRTYPEGASLFTRIRRLNSPEDIMSEVYREMIEVRV